MIKASLNELMPVYQKLFNTTLRLGIMPLTWRGGLITPIHLSINQEEEVTFTGVFVSQAV